MQATMKQEAKKAKSVDEYLGYSIREVAGWFLAVPTGWGGEVLEAADMPKLRLKIWRWWHQPA